MKLRRVDGFERHARGIRERIDPEADDRPSEQSQECSA
jgi:hypothetical protein